MNEPADAELDPREELASLVASTRALLEQYEASGADLLVAEDPAMVAAFLAGQPLAPPRAASGNPAHATSGGPSRAASGGPGAPRPPAASSPGAFTPHPPSAAFTPPPPPATFTPHPPAAAFTPPAGFAPASPRRPAEAAAPSTFRDEPRPAIPPHEPPRDMAPRHAQSRPSQEPAPPHAGPAAPRAPQPQLTSAAGLSGASAEGGDDRRMRLALLAEEVRPCTKCRLCDARTQTVFARGNPYSEVCFVGEGPGADEDAQGEPFVGAAGQLLDKMVAAMGYRRDDVYICNVVKCRPPKNRKPEQDEIDACLPYLRDQLTIVRPKVIVALGATAVAGLLGATEGITRLRGKWKLYKGTIPIMPTFHPAYLLRNPAAKRDVWSDLQEVMKHLGKAVPRPRGDP